jgi:hypothetical protein
MYGKKRNIQHRIDKAGRIIFESALPNSKKFSFVFSLESEDYGIDGQMQVFKNGLHEGEFLKAQLKSKGEAKYINNRQILSYPLDLDSAFFLIKKVQDPTVLIIVDNKSKRVFWFPIQTSVEAREALEKKLIETLAENPSITLHIDVNNNLLSSTRYQGLYSYLKEAKIKLSQEALLNVRVDKTLSAGIKHINAIERQMYELEGFDWVFRKGSLVTPGTVFSIETSDGKKVDYLPSKKYKPELAPKVTLRTKFSTRTKEDREKFEAFRKAVQDRIGSVNLDDANIDTFKVTVGSQVLDNNKGNDKVSINISPSKTRRIITLDNGTDELEHTAEIWAEDNTFIISSIVGQSLSIRFSRKLSDMKGKFNIGINPELMTSASQQLRLLDFIRNTKQLTISFIDAEGFKRRLLAGELDASSIVSDNQYNFAKALAEIEHKTGISVPFPLPDDLMREDINNVFWVHRILTQGKITQKITLSFSLQNKPPEQVEIGKYMSMTQNSPEIYLFRKPYVMLGFTQTIAGKITEMEMPKGNDKPTYKIQMEEAEISIKRTNT